jgi:hypothetical protein
MAPDERHGWWGFGGQGGATLGFIRVMCDFESKIEEYDSSVLIKGFAIFNGA